MHQKLYTPMRSAKRVLLSALFVNYGCTGAASPALQAQQGHPQHAASSTQVQEIPYTHDTPSPCAPITGLLLGGMQGGAGSEVVASRSSSTSANLPEDGMLSEEVLAARLDRGESREALGKTIASDPHTTLSGLLVQVGRTKRPLVREVWVDALKRLSATATAAAMEPLCKALLSDAQHEAAQQGFQSFAQKAALQESQKLLETLTKRLKEQQGKREMQKRIIEPIKALLVAGAAQQIEPKAFEALLALCTQKDLILGKRASEALEAVVYKAPDAALALLCKPFQKQKHEVYGAENVSGLVKLAIRKATDQANQQALEVLLKTYEHEEQRYGSEQIKCRAVADELLKLLCVVSEKLWKHKTGRRLEEGVLKVLGNVVHQAGGDKALCTQVAETLCCIASCGSEKVWPVLQQAATSSPYDEVRVKSLQGMGALVQGDTPLADKVMESLKEMYQTTEASPAVRTAALEAIEQVARKVHRLKEGAKKLLSQVANDSSCDSALQQVAARLFKDLEASTKSKKTQLAMPRRNPLLAQYTQRVEKLFQQALRKGALSQADFDRGVSALIEEIDERQSALLEGQEEITENLEDNHKAVIEHIRLVKADLDPKLLLLQKSINTGLSKLRQEAEQGQLKTKEALQQALVGVKEELGARLQDQEARFDGMERQNSLVLEKLAELQASLVNRVAQKAAPAAGAQGSDYGEAFLAYEKACLRVVEAENKAGLAKQRQGETRMQRQRYDQAETRFLRAKECYERALEEWPPSLSSDHALVQEVRQNLAKVEAALKEIYAAQ